MKIKRLILYLAVVVISIGSIPICKAIYTLSGDWRLVSEPLHSTMEALGALATILMAPLLLEKRREGYDGKFFFLAMGFLGIGLLGGFHAAASLGRGSVLLYSMANLVGGFCFALIWLPRGSFARDGAFERWFPRAVIMGSAFLGIWTLMGRESLAVMVRDSEFTATAVWINLLGGVFFLAAAGRLLLDFHHFNEQESWLLALIAVLLGVTGLMFRYSSMWGMSWWFWHLVRMIAFLLMLRVLFSDFRQRAFNLRAALAEHKRAEEALHVTHHFLEIANRHIEMRLLLKEFVAEVRKFTGCTSVGIRILDKEGNIPYQAYEGFSRRFYELESPLSIKSDQCLCINVIKGLAHQNLPYCTKGGSFYINATTRFLNTLSEEEKRQAPNVCNEFGYESVALVPIRVKGRVLGLIHVADPQENMIPLHRVAGLEKISMQLGAAIQRVQIGEALQQQREALAIHSGILSIILQTMDLDQRLNIILDEVLAFLKVEFGCIHLVQGNEVVLRCWRGISDTLRAQISSFSGDKIPDWIRKPFVTHEWLSEQGLTPEFLKNEQIQAWSSLPLYVRPKEDREREWLAVIMVCSRRYDAIDEDQVRVLTIIGDQVALAIDHARTHRQARERMVRLHTLREIDKAIMQRLHFSEVLHVVLERVPKNLGADAAAISLLDAKKRDTNVFAMRLPDGTFIEEEAFILADSLLHL
ncbi:MAG: GAF domain-containing protein, partial [Proteobacteria bacterium]|nr:GAF domain-containing protein [Pseudomonadota bacterium]